MKDSALPCVLVRLYECVILLTPSADCFPQLTIAESGCRVTAENMC